MRSVLAGVCPKTGNEYRENITILGKKTRERDRKVNIVRILRYLARKPERDRTARSDGRRAWGTRSVE